MKKPQQLCFTNTEMKAELINVLKNRIQNSSLKYGSMLITQEDNQGFCDCSACKAEIDEYGYSGLLMRFINEIADIMNPWVEETFQGKKEIKWVVFAYGKTADPPTVKNKDGSISTGELGEIMKALGANPTKEELFKSIDSKRMLESIKNDLINNLS